MKLIPFSSDHLQFGTTLPFGVRDSDGTLVLPPGTAIVNRDQLAYLRTKSLFADENESLEWRRKLGAAMGVMLRRNAALRQIAEARPQDAAHESAAEASVSDQWHLLGTQLDVLLHEPDPDAAWVQRLQALHDRAGRLGQRRCDASLYHLIQGAGQASDHYSSQHALLVMLVCEQAAPLLGWGEAQVRSLGLAALSMNLAMAELQDQLAAADVSLTPPMREQIHQHPAQAAAKLRRAGVGDALWCEAVRLHHDRSDAQLPLAEIGEERQLARLLRRADIFTAKISRRRSRAPMSPVQAAREACLGAGGVPDEVGGALLRATGLYPPGSFVELVNGERGIVVARGRRANLPWVASLVAPSGMALGEPALRDTIETRYAVRAAVSGALVKVRPDHERILALR